MRKEHLIALRSKEKETLIGAGLL
jgi:hypothetical protein